jgi:hypothetical protein
MSLTSELMAQSIPSGLASQLGYDTVQTGVSAAGSTQATATQLTSDAAIVSTVSASQGVILPNRPGEFAVTNTSATNLNVYPPVGSTFAASTVNLPRVLAQNQTMRGNTAGTTIFAVTSS